MNVREGWWCYRIRPGRGLLGRVNRGRTRFTPLATRYQSVRSLQQLIRSSRGARRTQLKAILVALKSCQQFAQPSATPTPSPTPTSSGGTPTATSTPGMNLPPVAVLRLPETEVIGQAITLDGSESSDPNGDSLTFSFRVVTRPAGSSAQITGTGSTPSFIPDVVGSYLFELVVSDGLLESAPASSTVPVVRGFHVGPGRHYVKPSLVSGLVQDGDTVLIDAGEYVADVARWSRNELTLKGIGNGFAHLRAAGANYGGKAIWVIAGANTTVENIEFSEAAVPDNNGAGIRQEGTNLTVIRSYFHDNQEGILAGDRPGSVISILHSRFIRNGHSNGYAHNFYVNRIAQLNILYSYFSRAIVGHEIKSRAAINVIAFNRISNETGNGSYEVDLPNAGRSYIIGNLIEQGSSSGNSYIITSGEENSWHGERDLFVVNNTIINNRGGGVFVRNTTDVGALLVNNLLIGNGTVLQGLGTSTANIQRSTGAAAGVVDAANFDIRLLAGSPAINSGVDPGVGVGLALAPPFEYLHPVAFRPRPSSGVIDVGAVEYVP